MQQIRPNFMYPLLVGILLGLLQSGLFFLLTFTMSSGFTTYLLITLCWLMGGVIGALYVNRLNISLHHLPLIMLLACALCTWLVSDNPFNTQMWPVYGCLISLAGIYPGVFFARASNHYAVRSLFFWENNGFIVGLVINTLSFMLFGRNILWMLTILLAALVWFLSLPRSNAINQSTRSDYLFHIGSNTSRLAASGNSLNISKILRSLLRRVSL